MYVKIESPPDDEFGRSHIYECDSLSWGPWCGVLDDTTWNPYQCDENEKDSGKTIFLYVDREPIQSVLLPWGVSVYVMNDGGKTIDRI